jgi:hypothetical protein
MRVQVRDWTGIWVYLCLINQPLIRLYEYLARATHG